MNQQQRDIFVDNIKRMLKLLECDYKNVNRKYKSFPIPITSLRRWMEEKNIPNKEWSWAAEFLTFYNSRFEPEIDECSRFYTVKLSMELKKEVCFEDLIVRYQGEYFIYYFSNHYKDVIHSGKLLILSNNESSSARLILGIQDVEQLRDKVFCNIFDENIDIEEANDRFQKYKNMQPTDLRQRCYFYEGKIKIDRYNLKIEFTGKNERKNHKQTLFLNIKKKPRNSSKPYKGGLGIVLASPNEYHTDLRIYKMGISRHELFFNESNFKEMLKLVTNSLYRISVTADEDQIWYDKILLKEQEIFDKKQITK